MKAAEDNRPMGMRPDKLPAARRPKRPSDLDALLHVDWVDELFTTVDTRRR